MTEIEQKAQALVDEVILEVSSSTLVRFDPYNPTLEAVRRAIEQHEAFRQEVSDAVEGYACMVGLDPKRYFARFILPKPDPLVEALKEIDAGVSPTWIERIAPQLRAALAARGLEIREKQP